MESEKKEPERKYPDLFQILEGQLGAGLKYEHEYKERGDSEKVKFKTERERILMEFTALVEEVYEKEKRRGLLKLASELYVNFRKKKALEGLVDGLYTVSYREEYGKIVNYIRSVYLKGSYERFVKLKPSEVVKMVRYYLGEKGMEMKQRTVPLLKRLAKRERRRIYNAIRYRLRENIFMNEEMAFEEVKKSYLERKEKD